MAVLGGILTVNISVSNLLTLSTVFRAAFNFSIVFIIDVILIASPISSIVSLN